MNVVYSPRAARDLEAIAAYCRAVAGPRIAAAIGARIERVISRVAEHPHRAPRVLQRRGIRVALVIRYPYKIFLSDAAKRSRFRTFVIRHGDRGQSKSDAPAARRSCE